TRVIALSRYALVNTCTKSGEVARRPARRPLVAQGGAQPGLADPPEVVLHTVDEGDGDLLAVGVEVALRLGDIPLFPGHAEVVGDPHDHFPGVVAQVAAGPVEQRDDVPGRRPGGRVRHGRSGPFWRPRPLPRSP